MTITTAVPKNLSIPPKVKGFESRIEPQEAKEELDWSQEVIDLEVEWKNMQSESGTSVVSHYKFFEKVRGRITHAYSAYSEPVAVEIASKLEILKLEITPYILTPQSVA